MYNMAYLIDVEAYIDEINAIKKTGETTEHSFRGVLQNLVSKIVNDGVRKESNRIIIINEPKRKSYGAPDFEFRKNDNIISFLETKDIGDTDIKGDNPKKHKSQFDKYKNAVNTIAFTDYIKFFLFEKGVETKSSIIANLIDDEYVITNDEQQIQNFFDIVAILANSEPQPIRSANMLAEIMAAKAKVIADLLNKAMEKSEDDRTDEDEGLHGKLRLFRKFLVHDMNYEQFTDFYAQTILYGLFIARLKDETPHSFSLQEAAELIPSTNPFLRKIFKYIALAELHSNIKWVVDDLVSIFRVTEVNKILKNYGKDPIIHFYEDFLEKYNPKIREQFGVWYTPKEVVNFIVDSVDDILKKKLNIEDGLANNSSMTWRGKETHRVQILDPATGTGTFLAVIADKLYNFFESQRGMWPEEVVKNIIPRLNGFEYLMAPYTMAHLKLASSLHLNEIDENKTGRLNIFLTNSLEEDHPEQKFDFARYITDESNAASKIKRDTPVMVVVGNPPYNENSANNNDWIMDLMNDYKQEPGMTRLRTKGVNGRSRYKNTLEEPNSKGINNDYCKFIRLGQKFVESTNEGVLAYICANTFLDTRLFRGMRYELLKKFDEIYIINLHGSTKRKETNNDRKDECIFDIMVGVSINIFIKYKDVDHTNLARVYYKDLYGPRRDKLEYLTKNTLCSIDFQELSLTNPLYTFRLRDNDLKEVYECGFAIDELISKDVKQGLKTGLDSIIIHYTKDSIEGFAEDVKNKDFETICQKYNINKSEKNKEKYDWLQRNVNDKKIKTLENITEMAYRPFDNRWTIYGKGTMNRYRPEIKKNILNKRNFVLCLGKEGSTQGDSEWNLVYSSILPTDMNIIPRGGVYLFPLFVYDEEGAANINFSKIIVDRIEQIIGKHLLDVNATERDENGFIALDLFDYIYAVLHSTIYRKKYHECLQDGFPKIPYPNSSEYFFEMVKLGEKLRRLHQLEGIGRSDLITGYPQSLPNDNNLVTMKRWEQTGDGFGRIWINDGQYFDRVPYETWCLFVSGYRPLDKWLDDRKNKVLTNDEVFHYQKMIVALSRQIDVMKLIDKTIKL